MIYDFVKRTIDIVGSVVGLIIFSPFILIIAVAIKLESPGSALFTQPRITSYGRIFRMFKFRSMYLDADEKFLHSNLKLLEKFKSNSWKLPLHEDPRVTRIGRFIRRTSLDELPQFLNVLRGEMSLVGPRAFRPEELESQKKVYPDSLYEIEISQTVKPGITGPWQIGGRSKIDFPERVKMDAVYAKRRSITYDLWVILKTPFAVIQQEGAA